jgi:hypothetical protein
MFQTQMFYSARSEIFTTEKAFQTDYSVDHVPGARGTNHENDVQEVTVSQITNLDQWDLDTHGFCIIKAETSLRSKDAFSRKEAFEGPGAREEAEKKYWYKIEAILHEKFPEYSRIENYNCTVSL